VCTGCRQQSFVDHVYSFLGFSNYAHQHGQLSAASCLGTAEHTQPAKTGKAHLM